ncbi:putative dehydrogenase [Allocatelliglobosispora scoriae]|uniref:Putative dehydrogenase n=1 Tax=Allocatelliglobosispora scoriae TaxID=643052 RepID=A0A841BLU2_9ACTN|nr:Gfo/Idh/MocA family oxidoreductase [Allocatelliglobosispora scoriae]MBB5868328.1 putative dehydrogenase [Allocatelliglobosispora scoriae]
MRIGIVGAGLQARRRLSAFGPADTLVAVAAPNPAVVEALAAPHGARPLEDWRDLVARPDLDAVLVTTPPDLHEEIAVAALTAGKHVLCEKPLASSAASAARMEAAAAAHGRVLHCGFNHRFHPAIRELGSIVHEGRYGRPLSAVGVYGYGYRAGYADEWRADPAVVSGGQLMEQGIHLVDLIDSLLFPIADVVAHTQETFGMAAGLEDDAHVMLRSATGQLAFVRSSLSLWRNRFTFDVTLERATVRVDGLGASYGEQTLIVDERGTGPFTSSVISFRGGDQSWGAEWRYFHDLVAANPAGPPDPAGRQALAVVEAAYESTRTGRWTPVPPPSPLQENR